MINDIMYYIWSRSRLHCIIKAGKERGFDGFDSVISECGVDLFDQYTSVRFSTVSTESINITRRN